MTRDEFISGDHDGESTCGEGRQVFLVSIASEHHTIERSLRGAVHDWFGSLALAVKPLQRPSCDMVVGEHPSAPKGGGTTSS